MPCDRHGQSFVEHLDQENAQDLAEDGNASATQLQPSQAARRPPSRQPTPVTGRLGSAAPRAAQANMPQVTVAPTAMVFLLLFLHWMCKPT